jgi:putative transposase
LLGAAATLDLFEQILERVWQWYGFYVYGYVVMREHVHLLVSEPERRNLAVALQMLKQISARKLREKSGQPFWQDRYYDFNVWSEHKRIEKLKYMHRNPVTRGRCSVPRTGNGVVFGTI